MPKVLIDGENLSLYQIAKRSGISKTTVCRRYQEGARTYAELTEINAIVSTPAGDIPVETVRKTPEEYKAFAELRDHLRTVSARNSTAVSRIREALLILNTITVDDFR